MIQSDEKSEKLFEGRTITAVEFVRDYIRVHFDYAILTAVTDPVVIVGEAEYKRGNIGYCDRLVGCIGRNVVGESVVEGDAIRIDLDDATAIAISLKSEDRVVQEAATFRDGPTNLWVW